MRHDPGHAAVYEHATDGVLLTAPDGHVRAANPAACRLLGLTEDEILARGRDGLRDPDDPRWDEALATRDRDGRVRRRLRMRRGDGTTVEVDLSSIRYLDDTGEHVVVIFRDLSEAAQREELLRSERAARASAEASRLTLAHRASHDPVTGLLNRAGLAEASASLTAEDEERPVAVLFVDLDDFKLVNDTWGHSVGDEALRAVALRLLGLVGPEDVIARFGGDEFVVLVPDADTARAERYAEQVVRSSQEAVRVSGRALSLSASVGLARARTARDLEGLLREADTALAHAKDSGRGRWVWYDEDLRRRVLERVAVEADLRTAIAAGGEDFRLVYQPAYTLTTGRPEHVEALVRWDHPERGRIPPADFIPVAEATGLVVELGALLVDRAVRRAARWHRDGVRTWVNVSQRQLVAPGLCRMIAETLRRHGCPAAALGIEVTESVLADPAVARDELVAVAELGVAIAIDDFGVGYSSMAALADMPLDVLKIDRSFVHRAGTPTGDAVVAAILNLGRALDLTVVAEGVETAEQLCRLREQGCDAASGFHLTPPRPAPDRWEGHVLDPR